MFPNITLSLSLSLTFAFQWCGNIKYNKWTSILIIARLYLSVTRYSSHLAFPRKLILDNSKPSTLKTLKTKHLQQRKPPEFTPYKQRCLHVDNAIKFKTLRNMYKKSPKHFARFNVPQLSTLPHTVSRIDKKISVFTNDFVCFKQTYKSRAQARYFNMCINGALISMYILKLRNNPT